MTDINSRMQAEIDTEDRIAEEKVQEQHSRSRRASALKKAEEEAKEREREAEQRRKRIRRKYPTQDQVEAEYVEVSSGEEMPLYFEEPKQLLDIYTSLEESNLFLIQNSQETEQALEEVEKKFEEHQRVLGAKAEKMSQQIGHLEKQIGDEKSRCDWLQNTVSQKRGTSEQDKLLQDLKEKILEVHGACGFDADHDPDPLQMLSDIEKKLEEYLTNLDGLEVDLPDVIKRLELEKEKERRERVKQKRKEITEKKTEERLKNSLLRSQAPVHKKTGKQIMFRSAPLHMQKKVIVVDDSYEEAKKDFKKFGIHFQHGIPEGNE